MARCDEGGCACRVEEPCMAVYGGIVYYCEDHCPGVIDGSACWNGHKGAIDPDLRADALRVHADLAAHSDADDLREMKDWRLADEVALRLRAAQRARVALDAYLESNPEARAYVRVWIACEHLLRAAEVEQEARR